MSKNLNERAWQEITSLLDEGYILTHSAILYGKQHYYLYHSRNCFRIHIEATELEYWIYKKRKGSSVYHLVKHE